MNKIYIRLISLALMATGLAILLFPTISDKIYTYKVTVMMEKYIEKYADLENSIYSPDDLLLDPENIPEDLQPESISVLDKLYKDMLGYNEKLFLSGQMDLSDPFSYEHSNIDLMEFGFAENIIGYLSIPQINITLPVYLGASNSNMKKGAAHLTQTSLPVGGLNSNSVISAHRGMSTAKMFRQLDQLKIGDIISLTNFREKLIYKVAETKIIYPTDIEEILIQPGRDLLTLLTCNPIGHNYERYVVICERIL